MGPFKIIKIPSMQSERFLPEVSRSGRVAETMRFVREAAEELITRRAFVYTVEQPTGARGAFSNPGLMILDDDELERARKARTLEGAYTFLKNSCMISFFLFYFYSHHHNSSFGLFMQVGVIRLLRKCCFIVRKTNFHLLTQN